MRKFTFLILIAITSFLSCNYAQKKTEKRSAENKTEFKSDTVFNTVTLSIEPDVFRLSAIPDTVMVKMENNSNDTITTGLHYRIEVFKKDEWRKVSPTDMAFHDIGFTLNPSENKIFKKYLLKNQINYNIGKYRIVKYYLKSDYRVTKENFDLYAEFEIE